MTSFPFLVRVLRVSSVFVRAEPLADLIPREFFNTHRGTAAYMHFLSRSSLPHLLYRFPDRFAFSCGLCICMRAGALAASNALLLSNKESEGNLVAEVEDARRQ